MLDLHHYSPTLTLDAEGIWTAGATAAVSYPAEDHDACLAIEDGSFWFGHRNQAIVAIARRFLPMADGPLFDIGGGNGFVARGLAAAGYDVVLVEPGRNGALNARRRGLSHVVCATADTAGFNDGTLPALGLFDVIEHIDDDAAFLGSMARLLKPGGTLLATVPAYRWLWSDEDELAGHFRRYTKAEICTVLRAAGFEIEFASYFFRLLPLPILLLRSLPFRFGLRHKARKPASAASDHNAGHGPMARLLGRMLSRELALLCAGRELAFGGSLLLVARRLA